MKILTPRLTNAFFITEHQNDDDNNNIQSKKLTRKYDFFNKTCILVLSQSYFSSHVRNVISTTDERIKKCELR